MKNHEFEPSPVVIFLDSIIHGLLRLIGLEKSPFTDVELGEKAPRKWTEE